MCEWSPPEHKELGPIVRQQTVQPHQVADGYAGDLRCVIELKFFEPAAGFLRRQILDPIDDPH
ncbi:hypothetical protein [Mycolicibacterium komossense]|uniref:Uncharacterized protein n=1 Tax=Mycolicibacterium komossense TaxID=1779 RepID=A0ABT3CM46_9MYCO|nr:hypothetical protein [Mycolicibacterium komossense]MCV7230418.1 hypothetical protein [Mycolicibacterium komossense]